MRLSKVKMDHAVSHMGETTSSKNTNKNVNKSVLDIFREIGDGANTGRNKSCISLVQHLAKSLEDVSSGDLPKDVTYSLKRLVRGLGSKYEDMQKGYFTALVAVLGTFPAITAEVYDGIVQNEFGSNEKESKGEVGEALLGKVLACGAAIRGGLFLRSSVDNQKEILTTLLTCASKRSYLPYASAPFLHDLMTNVEESVLSEVIWPLLDNHVLKPWADQTLDSLLLLLSVLNRLPHVVKSKKIQKNVGFLLFSTESMHHFAQKLVGDSSSVQLKHPVYEEFCKSLTLPENEALLKTFWTKEVDSLLSPANNSRDHAALQFFTLLLRGLPNKKQIGMLVTPSILDVIRRTFCKPPNEKNKCVELCAKAQEALTCLGDVLTADDATDKTRLSVIKKMIFCGDLQYEKQTGSRITILLENKLSKKGVQDLAKQFRDVVDGISSEGGKIWKTDDRIFAAQQLKRLIGHQACNNDNEWKVEQLLFFLDRGLFNEAAHSKFNVDLAANMRQCFFRALDEAFSNLTTMVVILSQIVQHINKLMSDQGKFRKTLKVPFGEEAFAAWQQMMKTVSSLEKKKENGSEFQIFHSLFLFMGLQLFSNPKATIESLQELHSCYERIKGGRRKSKNSEEPQWIEVTVEVLLSLLSNGSHLLRTVVGTVFPHLCKHLTLPAFYQILEVLDPSQNDNPLTSTGELDSAGESESEDEDEEMPSNGTHEASDGENTPDEEGDSEEEDDDDEYEDIDDEDMEDTLNDKFRDDIRQALGEAAYQTDTESVDLDDITEEEGERMNIALTKAFKAMKMSRTSKKNKKQVKKEEVLTHFRIRVLDLVDLYISKQPSMEFCLECVTPLLSLLAFCLKDVHQKPLEIRTRRVLNKLTGLKKFSSVSGVEEKSLADQIKSLVTRGVHSTTTFLGLSNLISDCCAFLVRCSDIVRVQSPNSEKQNPVVSIYEALILEYFTKRETLLSINIFKEVLNSQWSGCWCIAPSIVQYAFSSEVRLFRRSQAIDLLTQLFSNKRLVNLADDKQQKRLKKIVSSIISHSIEMLNVSDADSSGKVQLNKRCIAAVMRLLYQILSSPKARPADVSHLSASVTSFCQNSVGVPLDARKCLGNVLKQLKLDNSLLKNLKKVDDAQLINESISDNEETPQSKKQRKANKNKVNGSLSSNDTGSRHKEQRPSPKEPSKKAKKMQRMALMGEGIDSSVFSKVNDVDINGMEPSDEEMDVSSNVTSKINGFLDTNEITAIKRKQKHSTSEDTQRGRKKKKNH